jgi:hypothetical protein
MRLSQWQTAAERRTRNESEYIIYILSAYIWFSLPYPSTPHHTRDQERIAGMSKVDYDVSPECPTQLRPFLRWQRVGRLRWQYGRVPTIQTVSVSGVSGVGMGRGWAAVPWNTEKG